MSRLILIEFRSLSYQSKALKRGYQKCFEFVLKRSSVWPQMGRKVIETPKDGADSRRFREFAAERFV